MRRCGPLARTTFFRHTRCNPQTHTTTHTITHATAALPAFLDATMAAHGVPDGVAHLAFLALVVMNLVAGFQALGTLMGREARPEH